MTKLAPRQSGAFQPFQIGLFTFTATGMEVTGRPSFAEYEAAGVFVKGAHQASGFWLSDYLRYGDSRSDWADRLSQVVDATGMSAKTLKNVRAVGAIAPSRRRDGSRGVEFGHHEAVAALSPDDQTRWLGKAEDGGWTVRELRNAIRAEARHVVIEGKADQMHAVEVMVLVDIEAKNETTAEGMAWELVKGALKLHEARGATSVSTKVIASHARPR